MATIRALSVGATAVALATVVLTCVVEAQQPPLAEVARREAARRKAIQSTTKVLTNKDLPRTTSPRPAAVPSAAEPADAPAAAPAAEAAAATPAPGDVAPEKNEAWWRARMTQLREAVARNEILAEALQSRINALATDFVARDDPYQRARIGEDRQKALAAKADVQSDIAELKKSIEDLEEEARKSSVPPGWLR